MKKKNISPLAAFGNPISKPVKFYILTPKECEEFSQIGFFRMLSKKMKEEESNLELDNG